MLLHKSLIEEDVSLFEKNPSSKRGVKTKILRASEEPTWRKETNRTPSSSSLKSKRGAAVLKEKQVRLKILQGSGTTINSETHKLYGRTVLIPKISGFIIVSHLNSKSF